MERRAGSTCSFLALFTARSRNGLHFSLLLIQIGGLRKIISKSNYKHGIKERGVVKKICVNGLKVERVLGKQKVREADCRSSFPCSVALDPCYCECFVQEKWLCLYPEKCFEIIKPRLPDGCLGSVMLLGAGFFHCF